MSDIVERLRDASYENAPSRCMEAAKEIERLVKALDWAMARVIRKAPHHAFEGDGELYAFAEAHSLLAKLRPSAVVSAPTERGNAS